MKMFTSPEPPPFPSGTPGFVRDLTTWKNLTPHWSRGASPTPTELDLREGFHWEFNFPDPEKLLDSAIHHLERFAHQAAWKLSGPVAVRTEFNAELQHEDFIFEATSQGIILQGGTIEALRRAIYFLEEELAAAPHMALKLGRQTKHYWLHNRISRCFFGPIKRPPFNHDELLDDVDYYPEAYLDQLAREGVNGLWLTIEFKEICQTSFLPVDPQRERRLAKLRQAVQKCRKYGIKLWAFAIEPRAWGGNNPLPAAHSEMGGIKLGDDRQLFCPGSMASQQYLYESTYSLFSAVPNLGGLLLISHGERPTSCLSECSTTSAGHISCPVHAKVPHGEILRQVLNPMLRGMREAAPEAELISWLYQPQPEQAGEWVFGVPQHLQKDIILAYNFESGCRKTQLGKLRNGGDYWLSCVGPAERFGRVAQMAQGHCQMAAKLQVGCSHEVATIPYVPVPGLLYRKYKAMHQLGVSHVMQCWYFGNYPGVMNLAAGKLACEEFRDEEPDFLTRLARPEWGDNAPEVAAVWHQLGDAYEHYPLGYEFQYYGPMHDGPVWPLHLKVAHTRLPRTWKPETFAAGDAIGESLLNFDINEAVILSRQLADKWHRGTVELQQIVAQLPGEVARQLDLNVVEALDCQFQSGADILLFYLLRNNLINTNCGAYTVIDQLTQIARQEVEITRQLLELTQRDPRLGYHSEAEVYKYFPAKLKWRLATLQSLLEQELPALRTGLAQGKSPQELLATEDECVSLNRDYAAETFQWRAEIAAGHLRLNLKFKSCRPEEAREVFVIFLNDRLGAFRPRNLHLNLARRQLIDTQEVAQAQWSESAGSISCQLEIPLYSLHDNSGCRLGMARCPGPGADGHWESWPDGKYDSDIDYRLQYGLNMPERTRFLRF